MALDWDRQPEEPAKAYAAFCRYRDLPATERSLNAAYAAERKRRGQVKAPGYWCEWSSDWRWPDRAAAYDAYLDAERRRIREARLKDLETRRIDREFDEQDQVEHHADRIDELLDRFLDSILKRKKGDPPVIIQGRDLSGLARLVKERRELARQAVLGLRETDSAEQSSQGAAGHGTFEWVKPKPPDEPESSPPAAAS